MKFHFAVIFILFFSNLFLHAQHSSVLNSLYSDKTNHTMLLSQEEINAMKLPSNGFICINTTTNCINYFINMQWYEVCGECVSKIKQNAIIDTLLINDYNITIQFNNKGVDSATNYVVLIKPDSILLKSYKPEISINNLSYGTYQLEYYLENKCGKGPMAYINSIHVKPKLICTDSVLIFNKNVYPIASIKNSCWFISDLKETSSSNYYTSSKGNYYYAFKTVQNEKVCPSGWHIPTSADANELIDYFKTTDRSIQFNLSYAGSYINKDKVINEGIGNTYWIYDKGSNKERILVADIKGAFIVDVTGESVYATIRCVKD